MQVGRGLRAGARWLLAGAKGAWGQARQSPRTCQGQPARTNSAPGIDIRHVAAGDEQDVDIRQRDPDQTAPCEEHVALVQPARSAPETTPDWRVRTRKA